MKHPYTVTEDRIEGTVFTARWLRTQLFLCEIPMLFLDWVVYGILKDWSSLPGVLKGVVVVLILVCLYGHAIPFLDRQKWFVMDEKGIAWHTRHKDLFLPWAAVGCVALHSPMNRNSFLMFTADRAYMPYGKLRLDTFTDSCLGVQFRPELVAFAQRHAVFAGPAGEGLTDEWAESIFDAVNGKGRPGGGSSPEGDREK